MLLWRLDQHFGGLVPGEIMVMVIFGRHYFTAPCARERRMAGALICSGINQKRARMTGSLLCQHLYQTLAHGLLRNQATAFVCARCLAILESHQLNFWIIGQVALHAINYRGLMNSPWFSQEQSVDDGCLHSLLCLWASEWLEFIPLISHCSFDGCTHRRVSY